ncbi:unnamed protein product [Soboliphyme baturini]|uniref:Uncharacterized protein n=1 Tax=Soboliphyme baturini TaxID=241478 RepID=A0A183ISE3_9BILA|nr:unnamed protein product [Soboliphyme baturini]
MKADAVDHDDKPVCRARAPLTLELLDANLNATEATATATATATTTTKVALQPQLVYTPDPRSRLGPHLAPLSIPLAVSVSGHFLLRSTTTHGMCPSVGWTSNSYIQC